MLKNALTEFNPCGVEFDSQIQISFLHPGDLFAYAERKYMYKNLLEISINAMRTFKHLVQQQPEESHSHTHSDLATARVGRQKKASG